MVIAGIYAENVCQFILKFYILTQELICIMGDNLNKRAYDLIHSGTPSQHIQFLTFWRSNREKLPRRTEKHEDQCMYGQNSDI